MALIWAAGFTGANALAPKWRRYMLAQAKADDRALPDAVRLAAMHDATQAKNDYDQAVVQAETALAQAAAAGQYSTHVLIAGVGAYDDASIPAVTTSVFGACTFAEWMLTRFQHADRQVGSVAMVLSPSAGQGDWIPGAVAASTLGLTAGDTLPLEKVTFANLKKEFARWLNRAGSQLDNAAWFYFSGHGVWKAVPLILPQDARLPARNQPADNLIDIHQTGVNLFNIAPSIQCFFIDACQEIPPALLQNIDAAPGEPLIRPVNAAQLAKLDACLYLGSYTGKAAYGPGNDAPFFTQELLFCLEKRGAQSTSPNGASWMVTTVSLRTALLAAGFYRAEIEKRKEIQFSVQGLTATFNADLCQFPGPPEAFVQVWCLPRTTMAVARLFVEDTDGQRSRPTARSEDWYTTVVTGNCKAGVLDPGTGLATTAIPFVAAPPLRPVSLPVQSQSVGGAGGGGPGGP